MRREFNQSLLPDKAPEKYTIQKVKNRRPPRKSPETTKLMKQLIREAGEAYSRKDLAKACYVKESTITGWIYGKPMGRMSHTLVAGYFCQIIPRRYKDLLTDIETAWGTR